LADNGQDLKLKPGVNAGTKHTLGNSTVIKTSPDARHGDFLSWIPEREVAFVLKCPHGPGDKRSERWGSAGGVIGISIFKHHHSSLSLCQALIFPINFTKLLFRFSGSTVSHWGFGCGISVSYRVVPKITLTIYNNRGPHVSQQSELLWLISSKSQYYSAGCSAEGQTRRNSGTDTSTHCWYRRYTTASEVAASLSTKLVSQGRRIGFALPRFRPLDVI
jgi:hypothetical protein